MTKNQFMEGLIFLVSFSLDLISIAAVAHVAVIQYTCPVFIYDQLYITAKNVK